MPYRNLIIENSAKLKVSNRQLLITTEKVHSVPIEDINSILIESMHSLITTAALAQLAQAGVAVFVCDEKHIPCAITLPFAQNSRNFGMIKAQESLTLPLCKRLWQQIVVSKISNQGKCLLIAGHPEASDQLLEMAKTVLSGDTTNVEARAAKYYFRTLFGNTFSRENDSDILNCALNYGYAIIRGQIARLIASYGLLPMKGIHHKSELNAYNLADDFIEPFRPLVDLFVASESLTEEKLTPAIKRKLYNLLNLDMQCNQQIHSVAFAAELLVQSFTRCCRRTVKELDLPVLLPLNQHSYD